METILITGSTKGIGFVLAQYLSKKYNVIVHGRKIKEKIDGIDKYIEFDLNSDNVEQLFDLTGPVDILINNAAVAKNNCVHVNAIVPMKLINHGITKGITRFINISSSAADFYHDEYSEYCLSKNMLESITRNLATKYKNDAIISCLKLDSIFKTSIIKYNLENGEEITNIIPSILTLLRFKQEDSGRIYSYKRLKKNLFLENKCNTRIISEEPILGLTQWNSENKLVGNYPKNDDITSFENFLSNKLGTNVDNISLVNGGITNSFDLLCKIFIQEKGDEVLCTSLTFTAMMNSITSRGGIIKNIYPQFINGEIDYNLNDILQQINPMTRMIYLVNPTYILCDSLDLEDFIKKVPKNIPIVIDECYVNFLTNNKCSLKFINDYFVFGLRSFSKGHGMPGYRTGFILSGNKYKNLIKSSMPFGHVQTFFLRDIQKNYDIHVKFKEKINKNLFHAKKKLKSMNIKCLGKGPFIILFFEDDIHFEIEGLINSEHISENSYIIQLIENPMKILNKIKI